MSKEKKQFLLIFFFIAAIAVLRFSPLGNILTFENLKQHRDALVLFVRNQYGLSVALYIAAYILVTAFSLPGAVILTLAGGFLFRTAPATVYVDLGATVGAVLAFLSARYLLGDRLQQKYSAFLSAFNEEAEKNGARYLLTVRFIPVFPFFLVNFLSGLTKIPLATFIWTTSLGIIPGTVVFAFAGSRIGSLNSLSEIVSGKALAAFAALALFTIFPVILDRIKRRRGRS